MDFLLYLYFMEETKVNYSATVYYANKALTISLLVILGSLAIMTFILKFFILNNNMQYFVVLFAFMFPFLFKKVIRRHYTRNVCFGFSPISIHILETNLSGKQSDNYEIFFSDIVSYTCVFSASNVTVIDLYLRNNKKYRFPVCDKMNMKQAVESRSFFSLFYYYISMYNSIAEKKDAHIISYKMTFIASKFGMKLISTITLILTVLSFYLFRYDPIQLVVILPTLFGIFSICMAFRISNIRYRTKIIPSIKPIIPHEYLE